MLTDFHPSLPSVGDDGGHIVHFCHDLHNTTGMGSHKFAFLNHFAVPLKTSWEGEKEKLSTWLAMLSNSKEAMNQSKSTR